MEKCHKDGWVRIMFRAKKGVMENEVYLLLASLNFVVSVATGTGFGDVTAHNWQEIMTVCPSIFVPGGCPMTDVP